MLTYQVRPRLFRLEGGTVLPFPVNGDVHFHFSPSQPFGVEGGGGHTAICIRNEGAEDLEIRKIYQILPDARAAKDKHIRIIDESGEDYLYPAEFFIH